MTTALAAELLAHIRAYRAATAQAAHAEAQIRATWAALQAAEAEERAQISIRREA